jgi:hypothetical protein
VKQLWKAVWRFLKKLKINFPYDPAIPLLGIYCKVYAPVYNRGTCTPMFITAPSIMASLEFPFSLIPGLANNVLADGITSHHGVLGLLIST